MRTACALSDTDVSSDVSVDPRASRSGPSCAHDAAADTDDAAEAGADAGASADADPGDGTAAGDGTPADDDGDPPDELQAHVNRTVSARTSMTNPAVGRDHRDRIGSR